MSNQIKVSPIPAFPHTPKMTTGMPNYNSRNTRSQGLVALIIHNNNQPQQVHRTPYNLLQCRCYQQHLWVVVALRYLVTKYLKLRTLLIIWSFLRLKGKSSNHVGKWADYQQVLNYYLLKFGFS